MDHGKHTGYTLSGHSHWIGKYHPLQMGNLGGQEGKKNHLIPSNLEHLNTCTYVM